jgi:hypothetical protein
MLWHQRYRCVECKRIIATDFQGRLFKHGPRKTPCVGSGSKPELVELSNPAGSYARAHSPSDYDGPFSSGDVEAYIEEAFSAGVEWARETEK